MRSNVIITENEKDLSDTRNKRLKSYANLNNLKYVLKIENLEVFTTLYSKSENSNTKGYLLLMSGGSCDDPSFLKHDV